MKVNGLLIHVMFVKQIFLQKETLYNYTKTGNEGKKFECKICDAKLKKCLTGHILSFHEGKTPFSYKFVMQIIHKEREAL